MIDIDSHQYLSLPSQTSSVPESLKLPPYLRLIFLVLSANFVLVITWLALARSAPLPQNPFAAYEPLSPGQPWISVQAHEFSCYPIPSLFPNEVSAECLLRPQTGPFSYVNISIEDGVITGIVFTVRENTVRLGDLSVLWGRPEVEFQRSSIIFMWPDYGISAWAEARGRHFTYIAPISAVWFSRNRFVP
jgi:hypothetical protein